MLRGVRLDQDRASILLIHAPDHPATAEAAGVSLQLSGHTHLGQFYSWSWFARKMYRQFVCGLELDWEDAGVYFERGWDLGTAAAVGVESGDNDVGVSVGRWL